jgi:hypothetical protein
MSAIVTDAHIQVAHQNGAVRPLIAQQKHCALRVEYCKYNFCCILGVRHAHLCVIAMLFGHREGRRADGQNHKFSRGSSESSLGDLRSHVAEPPVDSLGGKQLHYTSG